MAQVMNPATTPSLLLDGKQTSEPVNDENAAPSTSTPATNGNKITVFHDPDNFNVKHPLQHQWTLWFTKPPSGKGDNWNDLLKEVVTFDSVEEFWGVYVHSHFPTISSSACQSVCPTNPPARTTSPPAPNSP